MNTVATTPENAAQGSDARMEIRFSDDELQAFIAEYTPAASGGRGLTPERIKILAQYAGVSVPLSKDGVLQAVEAMDTGQSPVGIVIATGRAPTPAQDAHVEYAGDPGLPVFPGDTIGVLMPPKPSTDGLTVDGVALATENPAAPLELRLDDNSGIILNDATGELRAQRYGMVDIRHGKLRIRSLITIAADKLSATMTLYLKDSQGKPYTMGRVKDAFGAAGIRVQPEVEAIKQALQAVKSSGKPMEHVVVAKAILPEDGEDGVFEPTFEQISFGSVAEDGRLDYCERGAAQTVQPGTVLGTIRPPTAGTAGMNVLGEPLAATPGRPCHLEAGEGVEIDADKVTYRAASEGVIILTPEQLSVSDLYVVEGDVNYAVGNLRLKKGSVKVLGTVNSGFLIEAPGSVFVYETVEGATIEAGGDVLVQGGLSLGGKGHIKAGGKVYAKFAQRAVIHAKGDLRIDGSMTDCDVEVAGRIYCFANQGIIQGGTLRCGRGVVAKEIGSPMGVATHIILGLKLKPDEELQEEVRQLKEQIARIEMGMNFGRATPQEVLARLPEAKRPAVAKLFEALQALQTRLEQLRQLMSENQERQRLALKATVRIQAAVHPGVSITIGGATAHVTESCREAKAYYDAHANKVVLTSLH